MNIAEFQGGRAYECDWYYTHLVGEGSHYAPTLQSTSDMVIRPYTAAREGRRGGP